MNSRDIWIRIAGNAANIRARKAHPWRCCLDRKPSEIPLRDWSVSGEATAANFIPGTSPDGDAAGLVAWIDCFGDAVFADGMLRIALRNPPQKP